MKGWVTPIPHEAAVPFIENYHYSHNVPTGKNFFFGWFVEDADEQLLYAVADYGTGVNPYLPRFLAAKTQEEVTDKNLVEIKRLCRMEPKRDSFPLTYFIAECNRQMARLGFRYVVSFSDPQYGHNGGIYKAANFQHIGQTQPEWHLVDRDGMIRHRRYAYRYSRRNRVPIQQAREELAVERVETPPKDRWFIAIGKNG